MRSPSIGHVLKNTAAGLGTTPEDVVNRFLGRTRSLTPGEQAELLGAFLEAAPPGGTQTSGGRVAAGGATGTGTRAAPQGQAPGRQAGGDFFSTLGRVASGVQQGAGFFTQGAQAISSIASLFGGSTAQNVSRIAGQLGQGGSQVSAMLQSLRGGQVPSLPTAPTAPAAGGPATGGGQFDATALLQLLISNPQFQQALLAAPVLGQGQMAVELVVPTKRGRPTVSIPLRAVVSTMAELASRSAAELATGAREDDAEYLVGERGELLVDSQKPASRAALVLHYVRMAGEAQRFAKSGDARFDETGNMGQRSRLLAPPIPRYRHAITPEDRHERQYE